ncbi:aspartate--tRNA(Asn) ligase [bacterium]|nr:aspartate--tRNA(Asn) ligase [bacterium]|tara:strand:- start:39959 stop:41290 length:1332 start_codon:yes stop_codon:yes gene_type:complete
MERTTIGQLSDKKGEKVHIAGWVDVRRDHGKLMFLVLRDRSGVAQAVVKSGVEAFETAQPLREQWVVSAQGTVNERPDNMKKDEQNGDIELVIEELTVLAPAAELPFDLDAELNLDTLLDYRPLTLRTQRGRDIFSVAATIVQAYRWALITREFTEFQAPALTGGDAEGGAEVFKVEYFHDRTAFLATSPQLYKEIMTGVYERAFTIAKIFRAEKSATTRHLSEVTQMDFEMGFIEDHLDVMEMLEAVIRDVCAAVVEKHPDVFARFDTEAPLLPNEAFPVLTLLEAQEIIEKEFGGKAVGEPDLEPEHERQICEWAKKEKGSDFVFITEFPTAKRAFYTYPDPNNPERSYSFDLLFRGLEINSGSQRFHDYDQMVETIKERGMDPEKFSFYLQMHKYGVPPHGGCSTGLERFTARVLNIANVKEAVPFPRDMNRIDSRLSEE